jgi:cytochrome c oxidase accessory protein FixG
MLFFVIAGAVLTIAFVTAVWGRLWCGYVCPQTVFVDGVYRKIEGWIEGDALARKRLDEGPWTHEKWTKKSVKWGLFLIISLVIGHSFLAYFTGTEALEAMMLQSPWTNPGAFGVMAFVSGLVLFDFGWFREQFCTIACPYGRLQSVLMDDRSMVVGYDTKRGEPRRGVQSVEGKAGDCVNCYRCVAVCPTGIDIRRGTQLECIACSACIDACDRVMEKLGKPTGLIRYKTLEGNRDTVSPFRPRAMIYVLLLVTVFSGLFWNVSRHKTISAEFVRALETPYQVVTAPNGKELVTNHFKLDVRNQDFSAMTIKIQLDESAKAEGFELVTVQPKVSLDSGELKRLDIFFKFPKEKLKLGTATTSVQVIGKESINQEVRLVGPLH